jgi:glycosyltransferase involved in cell wall biosynthesis
MKNSNIDISIVAPIYNEEENIGLLYSELKMVMDKTGINYEILFIDDGSTDRTPELLSDLNKKDERVVVVNFRRNFGQTAAMSAGFDYARGEIIVTIDGDLQNDPEDIPKLLDKIKECDVVSGWRFERNDPFISRRLPSMIANWVISKVTGVELHDYGCTLKAYKSDVVKNIRLYGEMHRFIPAIASWMGVKIAEVQTNHRPRKFGKSKYGLSRTLRVVLDLITVKFLLSFSTRPIQIFGLLGILSGGAGLLITLYLSYLKLMQGADIGGRPLLLLGVFLILLGVQLIIMGLLGEMLVRIYYESQDKPIYVVKKVSGKND